MTKNTIPLTKLEQSLLATATSPWIQPTPTVEYVLSGREFDEGSWGGWTRFIPDILRDQWTTLSVEIRIVAYCVAVEAVKWDFELGNDN